MFRIRSGWLLPLFIVLLTATTLVQAQTATPQSTPTATPAPTEPPAIPVIQPTPVPSPPLSGDLWQQVGQVWAQNREAILLALIMALVTGVLVGVFFQRIAGQVADWLARLFHYLFDNFASAPLIRLRYEKEYRDTLAAAVQELQGGSLVDRPIRLDQMYVPSLLTEETQVEVRGDLVDRYRSKDEMRRQQQTRAVSAWDAVRRFHRFVVLGGPGAGKTTYLYHLAFMCAQRRRPEVQDHLPIFIRFRELVRDLAQVKRLEDVFPQVLAEMNFPHAERFLERQLAQGRCLILLDGLDEVPAEDDHQRLIELVQEFANRQVREPKEGQSHNILVVSSRKYSYEHGQQLRGFAKTEVMEFDTPAIERFIYNWFGGEGELTKELLAGLKGNPRFLELARNPLLLLLIAYHYERERNLPRLRAELYQHCIRTRITQWNTIRGTHRGRFGENIKWRLLRELALYIFQEEKEGLLRRELLLEWLGAFAQNLRLPEDTLPETLLDEVARTSGLIQEWAIDRYGFSHQTLQEYFAAEAVDRQSDEQAAALLAEYLENPAWQEVILLYCGLADNTGPLLGRLMGQARQRRETGLWQLAGRCLAEGAQGIPEERRQEVVDKLVGLLREAEGPLAADENEMVIANLKEFASDLLLLQVQALLADSGSQTLLLAERLLPDTASPELRQLLSQQLSSLASAENAAERQAAIAAMGRLGSDDAGTIATLLRGLQEADPAARAEAALACGRLGRADEAVVVALRQTCSTDPADAPRRAALEALLALRQEALVDMVFIPAGEFLMGSGDEDKAAENDEKPRHRLYLPAYFMDRSPVTNGQFARFMEAGGYANPDYWSEAIEAGRWREGKFVDHQLHGGQSREQPALWEDKKWNSDEQPVVGVSWYEALAYARWAGKRLPNEAEWEKAASWEQGGRSAEGQGSGGAEGKQRRYPWGNSWQPGRANTKEARLERTTPVGQFSPEGDSPYGLVDMAGNVWEWCSTRWRDEKEQVYGYPYNPDDGREALDGGDEVWRVLRGGSWYSDQKSARCAARDRDYPGFWNYYWGFRCCCATSSLVSGSEF
jgi:formylglycine-generating enzyme required for sulfatase activity